MTDVLRFEHGSRVPGWDDAADLSKDPATVPDPATTPVPDDLRATIEGYIARYPDRRSAVIPALAAAQRVHGWCSPQAIEQAACVLRLTPGYLASIATFYDMLYTEPVARHDVFVCTNISCSLLGADALYDAVREQAGEDVDFNVRAFECLGACDIGPMASVDGVYVGPLTLDDVPRLIEDVRAGRPVLEDKQLARRRVADPDANQRPFEATPGAADPVRPPERTAAGPPIDAPTGGDQIASDHGEQPDLAPPETAPHEDDS